MNNPLKNISKSMIERYSKRYREMGYDVKTLGWGSTEQQIYRFSQAISNVNFSASPSVLDIGCGFGDLLSTIKSHGKKPSKYIGWDINPDLISEANKRWAKDEISSEFHVLDLTTASNLKSIADVGFMIGVLNLNFHDKFDNYTYSKSLIKKAFDCVNSLLVVDFLSSHYSPDYPKEDFVFYHDPAFMLEFALTLTPNVAIKHNYASIPQKEFMLLLYK